MRFLVMLLILGLAGSVCADEVSIGRFDKSAAASDLIAWWQFDEGTGKIATDSSGFQNTATIRNGAWGDGKQKSALQMDGGNDSIVIVPGSDSLKSTANAFTLMAWTYRTAEHNVAVLAHSYPALFFGFHGSQFKVQISDKPGLFARAARRLGLSRERRAACYADRKYRAVLNKWIHMAATYDGAWVRLYVDAIEICSQKLSGLLSFDDSPFTISGYLKDDGIIIDEISGKLDDVRIYRRALDPAEIRAVYVELGE